MALSQIYARFFASPNPLSLAEDASLHYIPTLKSFSQQGPIVRHLESQNKDVVKVKSSKRISVVEGASSIALETETVLEFISGGGSYLPGLDTFIIDSVATLPMVCIHRDSQDILLILHRRTSFTSTPSARSPRFASPGTRALYLSRPK
jgi:hypothetical protein